MAKRSMAVIAGLITAFILIMVVQSVSHFIYPPPPNINIQDKEAMRKIIANMPLGAMLLLLFSYMFGSFGGGLVSAIVIKENRIITPILVGLFLTIAGISNLMMIPHPTWFAITSTLTYIPCSILGFSLKQKS